MFEIRYPTKFVIEPFLIPYNRKMMKKERKYV